MFFILPIGFLKVFHRFPWANIGLIATCVLLFALQIVDNGQWASNLILYPTTAPAELSDVPEIAEEFAAHAWTKQPWSLFTHALLHADFFHLVGNMVFLFVFGCALNGELGDLRYLLFWISAAVVAGIGHLLLSDSAIIGASGAICGVTGLVAALYPRNDVRIGYFFWIFFFIRCGTVEWSALSVVGMWFAMDVVSQVFLGQLSGVAYCAHIAGSAFGFGVGIAALKMGWVESDGHDFLSWHMGAKVAKVKRSRFERSPVRSDAPLHVAPAPAADWDPIPLIDDEPAVPVPAPAPKAPKPAPKRKPKPKPVTPSNAETVETPWQTNDTQVLDPIPPHQLLSDYFEGGIKASQIPADDIDKLISWYERYRTLHVGASISLKALLGMARLFVRRGDVERALDAYDRLLRGPAHSQVGLIALEAARFAADVKKTARARALLKRALACSLPPERHQVAMALQAKIGHA